MPRKVGPPCVIRPGRNARATSFPKQPPHPHDGAFRVAIDAGGHHHQDPPLVVIDRLAPVEIGLSVRLPIDVLATVVLHDHALARITRVVLAVRIAVEGPQRQIHFGLGKPGKDNQHP